MLRLQGQWEARSDDERHVLLAISWEIIAQEGLEVVDRNLVSITGFKEERLNGILWHLCEDGLVSIETPENMSCRFVQLIGDAVTTSLIPMSLFEEASSREKRRQRMALRLAQKAEDEDMKELGSLMKDFVEE